MVLLVEVIAIIMVGAFLEEVEELALQDIFREEMYMCVRPLVGMVILELEQFLVYHLLHHMLHHMSVREIQSQEQITKFFFQIVLLHQGGVEFQLLMVNSPMK